MPQFYAYNQYVPLGKERLGTDGRMIVKDLKTLKGVVRRCHKLGWKNFTIHTFSNFHDNSTFKLVYTYRYKPTPSDLLKHDLEFREGKISEEQLKDYIREVYYNDVAFENTLAHEIKILLSLNLLYRVIPLHHFGIHINLNDLRNE